MIQILAKFQNYSWAFRKGYSRGLHRYTTKKEWDFKNKNTMLTLQGKAVDTVQYNQPEIWQYLLQYSCLQDEDYNCWDESKVSYTLSLTQEAKTQVMCHVILLLTISWSMSMLNGIKGILQSQLTELMTNLLVWPIDSIIEG